MTAPAFPSLQSPKPNAVVGAIQERNQQYLGQSDADTQTYWDQQDELRKKKIAQISVPTTTPAAMDLTNPDKTANSLGTIDQTGQITRRGAENAAATIAQKQQAKQIKDWQTSQEAAYKTLQDNYQKSIKAMQYNGTASGSNAQGQNQGLVTNPNADSSGGTVKTGQYTFTDPKDQQIAAWARQAGWSEADIPTLIGIAQAESSRSNDATHANSNGTTDYGLVQINSVHAGSSYIPKGFFDNGGWKDPVENLKAAKAIHDNAGGWSPWVTFQNGDYEGYHPQYTVAKQDVQFGTQPVTDVGGQVNSTPSGLRQNLVATGMKYLGTPYVFAGDSLTQGVDCSGLVHEVFKMFNLKIPRTADEDSHPENYSQSAYGGNTGITGKRTTIANLKPGDLVCWQGGWRGDALVGHVAIYAGNNEIIESPDVGLTVRRRKLRDNEHDVSQGGRLIGIGLNLPGDS